MNSEIIYSPIAKMFRNSFLNIPTRMKRKFAYTCVHHLTKIALLVTFKDYISNKCDKKRSIITAAADQSAAAAAPAADQWERSAPAADQ
jgi:hypothetical protein